MDLFDSDMDDWPEAVGKKYERFEVLGKGSFGIVWMSRRIGPPVDEFDDEYTAIKVIKIKDEKSEVYAEREISILGELRHPNIIRLIKAYPIYRKARVVALQLARGPTLHQLVIKRGALGLPLARLVSRQLIAAVSYMHGRAVVSAGKSRVVNMCSLTG
jgi:serine/threonine protein kinase